MKKIIWILICVLTVALLTGCDIGVVDGPGMENTNVDESPDATSSTGKADENTYLMQQEKTILTALDNKKGFDKTDSAIKRLGAFATLASEDISENKLFPTQAQNKQAFAGYLLICFTAIVAVLGVQRKQKH